ncbi:MAG: RagB/SusD family nutrient uptake outer membrane protein [Muribaculaceae bacterium]|nr:RagB/SusD family nutrient uptake outer membrane protein [Muribaculaceae bacterium]
MKKNKIILTLALATTLGLSSCIEEINPTGSVIGPQIAASPDAVKGMVNAIYTTMAGYSNDDGGIENIGYAGLRVMPEHATTPFVCAGQQGWNTLGAWCYGAVSSNGSNRGIYPSYVYYGYIKAVNDILSLIAEDTDNEDLIHYRGIAKAYRALYYHDLVRVMEYIKPTDPRYTYTAPENDLTNLGVPIVTEKSTPAELSNNPRATVDEVYDLILSDLADAEKDLAGYTRSDKIEPNLAVIYGLYAQVYQSLASRTSTSEKYKDTNAYWQNAIKYADQAISTSGCSPLTEAQWTDPGNGFNNRNSQNSWMWATTISEGNTTAATEGSFQFAMLMDSESNFVIYGWGVGRSLDHKMYERLSDNDFRKKSWLRPEFFYVSKNQKDGEPYIVEKDANGAIINNKWQDANGDANDKYEGYGYTDYQFNCPLSWIRSYVYERFTTRPWVYLNLKFRPHNGVWNNYDTGGAVDYPIMRVEEMYFIKAEATYRTQGAAAGASVIVPLIKTRDSEYTGDKLLTDFMDEFNFQKQIEFWGEGVNYFDAKRQALGLHRAYKGVNVATRSHAIDVDGIFTGWTPGWNQAERNGNPAIERYNNPYTNPSQYYSTIDQTWLNENYGAPLDED